MKTGQRTASSSGEARATGDEREAQGTTGRKRNESLPLSRSLPPLRAHFFFSRETSAYEAGQRICMLTSRLKEMRLLKYFRTNDISTFLLHLIFAIYRI